MQPEPCFVYGATHLARLFGKSIYISKYLVDKKFTCDEDYEFDDNC